MRPTAPVLILVAAVVVAAAVLVGVGRPAAARGDVAAPDSVTTLGHGVVTLVPDEANVTAGVHTQAATAADALAQNSNLMIDVVAALKGAGGRDLQTQQVSLEPQTDANGNVQSYAADDSVSADAAIADAGKLVDQAVAAGANNVSGPTLSVSDYAARYRDALAKAVGDAKAKAEALAQAGSFALGAVSSVSEQGAPAPEPVFQAASAKSADTPIEPGTQDVTADCSVTFRIH